ncbi:uncharacterized protein LOC111862042 [Cryptotermes secundus]|uniref:uncharacterized protein LOC111862042 n=1 Tax=Cryptotermes secundus TaxID=105785 RepID=UPI000CD7D8BC|nr:uncharacterized protein LOC111862042 [Cryptotermes secundus]XP_033606423.1 uncharacterized protein LOC111862042 [Cryptotermes secundus]XP_033606424.1 uncharacterized protein LOC111862042 [Cryptotermes secundus]
MLLKRSCIPVKQQFQCYCWQCSLQTGTILAGWTGTALSLLVLLECIASLLNLVHLYSEEHSRISPAAYGFMSLLFHGFLIHGARNENPLMILPYLLFSLASFAVLVAFVVYILLRSYVTAEPTVSVLLTAGSALVAVLAFHIWVGIYSYYTELEDKLKPQPDFQLENLAFQKESELECNSISDSRTPLTKEFSHIPVPV